MRDGLCISIAMQHTATYCNTLKHAATHGNTHCNTLQHTATLSNYIPTDTCDRLCISVAMLDIWGIATCVYVFIEEEGGERDAENVRFQKKKKPVLMKSFVME